MRIHSPLRLYHTLSSTKRRAPLECLFELTYRCNLKCIHCYCQGLASRSPELPFAKIRSILDLLAGEGCMYLTFSGGDPLVRADFLRIYEYAKRKGFIISVFSNAFGLTEKTAQAIAKSPPFRFEVTLNGLTEQTYARVTRRKGAFARVMQNLKLLKAHKIPLFFKTNCLTVNKHEVARIKQWVDTFIARDPEAGFDFVYDPVVFPRLNGDRTPLRYRITPEDLAQIIARDADLRSEQRRSLECDLPEMARSANCLYHCDSWKQSVIVNPSGIARLCHYSGRYSFDLLRRPLGKTFKALVRRMEAARFKTQSPCRSCRLRQICDWCPERAFLETGSREKPVKDYCRFAEFLWQEDRRLRREKKTLP